MKNLWNLGKTQNSFCLELLFLKPCFLQFLHSFSSPSCFLPAVPWDTRAGRGTAPARLALSTSPCARGKHALELCGAGSEAVETGCFLCLSQAFVLPPPLPTAPPGEGAAVPFDLPAWCDRALLSPACRVICKQAQLLGSRNVFFSTRSKFIVWFPVRSLHFPSLPLPVSDTLFLTFCVALLVLPPVPQPPSFLILLKLLCFGGQGMIYFLRFLYFSTGAKHK